MPILTLNAFEATTGAVARRLLFSVDMNWTHEKDRRNERALVSKALDPALAGAAYLAEWQR